MTKIVCVFFSKNCLYLWGKLHIFLKVLIVSIISLNFKSDLCILRK